MAGLVPFNRSWGGKPFENFYNMIDDFFNDAWLPRNSTFKVDVQETDKEYLIEAELPGINKEEVDLTLNDGRLTIAVKRNEVVEEEEKNYIHKERRFSSMQRSIYLADAKHEGVNAKLDNGILFITIPKEEKPNNSRRINIE